MEQTDFIAKQSHDDDAIENYVAYPGIEHNWGTLRQTGTRDKRTKICTSSPAANWCARLAHWPVMAGMAFAKQ